MRFADVWLNNLDRASLDDTSGSSANGRNRSTDVLRAWKQEGDITDIPRIEIHTTVIILILLIDTLTMPLS